MNDRTAAVINGFKKLNRQERDDAIEEIKKVLDRVKKGELVEGTQISLGPIQGGCPCCGR
jgi:hypothetical protein